jgi:hypothetical protein
MTDRVLPCAVAGVGTRPWLADAVLAGGVGHRQASQPPAETTADMGGFVARHDSVSGLGWSQHRPL